MKYFYKDEENNEWCFRDSYVEGSVAIADVIYESIMERLSTESNLILKGDENGYPEIDVKPVSIEKKDIMNIINNDMNYLNETDWYAIRFADTGEDIPSEIKQLRKEARERISEMRERLENM